MRDRTPKMLVFPDLGSQVEVSIQRPRDSGYPWNTIMYLETGEASRYFYGAGLLKRNRGPESGNGSGRLGNRIPSKWGALEDGRTSGAGDRRRNFLVPRTARHSERGASAIPESQGNGRRRGTRFVPGA